MDSKMDAYLRCALLNGEVRNADHPVRLSIKRIGEIALPSGRLVACDPFTSYNTPPFTRAFSAGPHPVALSIAKIGEDHYRVAFALIGLINAMPVRWEMLLTPGADPSKLGPDEIFGYSVDAGTGAFMDSLTAKALAEKINEELSDMMQDEIEKQKPINFAVIAPAASGLPGPLFCFESGLGDGVYASYVGLTAQGQPAAVVTDFGVFELTTIQ